jgi:broad specificity phosphatase PhoE
MEEGGEEKHDVDAPSEEPAAGILRLYVVRHGETDYNRDGIFQGTSDIPLNENGVKQAHDIAEILRGTQFIAAYCSPLSRTLVTCEIILAGKRPPTRDERLREVYFGEWEGVHRDEIERRWSQQFSNYYSSIGDFEAPGGEGLAEARDRVGEFLNELVNRHPDGDVLIVGHQFINALLSTHIMGQDISDAWDYRARPGDVFIFELDGRSIGFRKLGG